MTPPVPALRVLCLYCSTLMSLIPGTPGYDEEDVCKGICQGCKP